MNNELIINTYRFIILILFQIFIFDNIAIGGDIHAYPYIIFILLYPMRGNRNVLLIMSFLLGLIIDSFNNSAGIHTTTCIVLAYLQNVYLKMAYGVSIEFNTIKMFNKITKEFIIYIVLSVFTHHFLLYLLEIFNTNFLWEILYKTLLSSLFSILMILSIISLLKPSKK